MRALPKLLLTLGLLAALLIGGIYLVEYATDTFGGKGKGKSSFEPAYPAQMTLTNTGGNEIEVTLLSRNAKFIQFERRSDLKIFIYALSDLSDKSRSQVEAYPNNGLSNAGDYLKDRTLTLQEVHVESLREAIQKLDLKLADLNAKKRRGVDSVTERGIEGDMKAITEEKQGLIAKIGAYDVEAAQVERSKDDGESTPSGSSRPSSEIPNSEGIIPPEVLKILDLRNDLLNDK